MNRGLVTLFFEGVRRIVQEHNILKASVVCNIDESECPLNVTTRYTISKGAVSAKVCGLMRHLINIYKIDLLIHKPPADDRRHATALPLIFANGERGATAYLLTGNPENEVPADSMIGAGDNDVAFYTKKGFGDVHAYL